MLILELPETRIMQALDWRPALRIALAYLTGRADGNRQVFATDEDIAEATNGNRQTLRLGVRELVKWGALDRVEHGYGYLYTIPEPGRLRVIADRLIREREQLF